jgi:nicotinamidase-related amidase
MNPKNTQVLFMDLQPGLIASSKTVQSASLANAAATLAHCATILALPMAFCVVPGGNAPGRIIAELAQYATNNNTHSRTVASPFMDKEIVSALAAHQRMHLVIAGFSAEVAVLQSALDAIDAGYSVYVPIDATGSRSGRTETAALRQIEKAGGVVTSVLSLVTTLAPDFSCPPGSLALRALESLRAAN